MHSELTNPSGEERFVKHQNIQTAVYIVHSDSKKTSLHAFSESKTVTCLLYPGPLTQGGLRFMRPAAPALPYSSAPVLSKES